ncbi:hypothetical protein [Rhizobium sp. P44RR-XXIV]|uniref:hypothetical protein n=1 Tax=Rhizobium sp. P44RR-XXIV TaxID=1921145 RepID=UPI001FF029C1|nr:hypothetical protein [Rhizobium sp. P44RR-XXIV]
MQTFFCEERPLCDRQILYGKKKLASTIAVIASFVMIAGCATTSTKPQETTEAAPQLSEAEQLAANLNDKAEARRQKGDAAYRDPRVHSVNGTQQRLVTEQNQALYPGAPTAAPSDAPASIAGLVTQPTGVNANRSSIFSAPPPIAVNPDGTLAKAQPDAGTQGITPGIRSVYSMPPSAMQAVAPQTGMAGSPATRTSEDFLPPPVVRNVSAQTAATPMKPTADATPSKIMPLPGSNVRKLDSKEAAMLANFIASKNQGKDGKLLVEPIQNGTGR